MKTNFLIIWLLYYPLKIQTKMLTTNTTTLILHFYFAWFASKEHYEFTFVALTLVAKIDNVQLVAINLHFFSQTSHRPSFSLKPMTQPTFMMMFRTLRIQPGEQSVKNIYTRAGRAVVESAIHGCLSRVTARTAAALCSGDVNERKVVTVLKILDFIFDSFNMYICCHCFIISNYHHRLHNCL